MKELISIQTELKAPKNQFNKFGGYKYRSQEDILEAVKPLLSKYGCFLTITDEIKQIGNYTFVEAAATITKQGESVRVTAQAGITERKGMDLAQSFGSSSSYARKYALNGLFLIDDTKDADATNTHDKPEIGDTERDELLNLLESSTYEERMRSQMRFKISGFTTLEEYNKAKTNLLANQVGIDGVVNPSQKDISKHIKKVVHG